MNLTCLDVFKVSLAMLTDFFHLAYYANTLSIYEKFHLSYTSTLIDISMTKLWVWKSGALLQQTFQL